MQTIYRKTVSEEDLRIQPSGLDTFGLEIIGSPFQDPFNGP